MPAKSKYTKKKNTGLTKKQASAVSKIAKKTMLKEAEVKYNVYNNTAVSLISATPAPSNMIVNTQNTTDTGHIGDQITLTKLKVSYFIEQNLNQPVYDTMFRNSHFVRVLIFQWFGNATPTAGNILPSTATNLNLNAFAPAHDYRQECHILYDQLHLISPWTGGAKVHNKLLKGYRKKLDFDNTSNDPMINDIFFMVWSNYQGDTHEVAPTITLSMLYEYNDS